MLGTELISRYAIWCSVTERGTHADFLRWQDALWIHWTEATDEGVATVAYHNDGLGPLAAKPLLRAAFDEWLVAQFNKRLLSR